MNDNLDQKQPGAKIDGNPQGSIIDLPPELTDLAEFLPRDPAVFF